MEPLVGSHWTPKPVKLASEMHLRAALEGSDQVNLVKGGHLYSRHSLTEVTLTNQSEAISDMALLQEAFLPTT